MNRLLSSAGAFGIAFAQWPDVATSRSSLGLITRRRTLRRLTLALGVIIAGVAAVPLLRFWFWPLGRNVVRAEDEPIDVGAADEVIGGAPPLGVAVIAQRSRDAWTVMTAKPLGMAWLARDESGSLFALSGTCPHLGCSVNFDVKEGVYRCPCHVSSFGRDGERIDGPARRGLDPLPIVVQDQRILIRFKRFRLNTVERTEVA